METSIAVRRLSFDLGDGAMAGIGFGEATRPVDVVFLHAAGFNAMTYRAMLAPLGERLHVIALDLRGHGRSTLPVQRGFASWRRHRDDIIAFLERYAPQTATLAGHSMGGTVSALVAGARSDLVSSLALLEPVLFSPNFYAASALPFASVLGLRTPLARGALRRRAQFPSREAAQDALQGRGIFKTFPPDMLADYVTDGFLEDGEGGVRLACNPRTEAANFAAHGHDPWRAIRAFQGPLVVLRAETNSTCPESAADRVKRLQPKARVALVEGASHALPMEEPGRARAAIESAHLLAASNTRFRDLD